MNNFVLPEYELTYSFERTFFMHKTDTPNILKLSLLYLSVIIGAGFATGREIRVYFTNYGISGFVGMVLALVLLSFAGSAISIIVYRENIDRMDEFNNFLIGNMFGKYLTIIITSFSYCLYVIILAGLADLFHNILGIEKILTTLTVTVLSIIIHMCGFRVLAMVCAVSAPLIAASVLIVASFSIKSDIIIRENFFNIKSLFSAILYTGYNSLVAVSILSRAKHIINGKKTAIIGSVIGTVMVMTSALFVNISLYQSYSLIKYSDMPLLTLVNLSMGNAGSVLFMVMLAGTMITSAISGLSSVLHITKGKFGVICVLASIPLSFIGFGNLMDILYPLYGFAGIFVLLMLVLSLRIFYNKKTLL